MKSGRSYIRSSSFVMAMLFTVLCGLVALSLGYFIDYFARGHFEQNTDAVIASEIRYLESLPASHPLPKNSGRLYIPLQIANTLPEDISPTKFSIGTDIIVFDYKDGRRYAAKKHAFSQNRIVLVAYDITEIARDFRFMQTMGIISIVFVMIVVFVSYLISVFVVKGTNKIADTARTIMETGDLSQRIDIGSRWDDLGNMASVLNILLSRIEQLMTGVRQVSDNIAHDLKTPLTRLRNKMESLPEQEGLLKEADHLLATFNALLRISRIETEKQRSRFQALNLRNVLQDVIDFYEPLAEEKSINLVKNLQSVTMEGDRDLLFQAYANIIDNALKYTPSGGTVSVSLLQYEQEIQIVVADTGAGVQNDDLEKIFERFYRCEESRNSSGTGLGLSLVAAVIELHRGRIAAENISQGFRIITIL